jgi:hypothetical protein
MSGGPLVDEQGRIVGVISQDGVASAASTLQAWPPSFRW